LADAGEKDNSGGGDTGRNGKNFLEHRISQNKKPKGSWVYSWISA
jgi:hypothetical protein